MWRLSGSRSGARLITDEPMREMPGKPQGHCRCCWRVRSKWTRAGGG